MASVMASNSTATLENGTSNPAAPEAKSSVGRISASLEPESSKKKRSTVVPLLLMLLMVGTVIFAYPGRFDAVDGVQPDCRRYVTKVAAFLAEDKNPQIIMLGSSLVLCPAAMCDLKMQNLQPANKDWFYGFFVPEYRFAKYLSKQIEKTTGKQLQIENLGVASSLMSDHSLLFRTLVQADKTPTLVVCGIAPRDFLDNSQPVVAKTSVHQLLADLRPEVLKDENNNANLSGALSWQTLQEKFNRKFALAKRAFTCLRQSINSSFCALLKRPDDDAYTHLVPGIAPEAANQYRDLDTYAKIYNPLHKERFAKQAGYLESMLKTAQEKHIAVLLVSMPLTRKNLQVLPLESRELYNKTVQQLAAKYNVKVLDWENSPLYQDSNFRDCCHLNTTGGTKFYQALAREIAPYFKQ